MGVVKVSHHSVNCRGELLDLTLPMVMGIINVTPDSFYAESRVSGEAELINLARRHVEAGAMMLDVGAMSTRPGAKEIDLEQEKNTLESAITAIRKHFPSTIISADTYRSVVAEAALDAGAHIINDIGGGLFDENMWPIVARYNAPYILMHNRVPSESMNDHTDYDDLVLEMLSYFYKQEWNARSAGITDVIIDPGIGFSKTIEQNFQLMRRLQEFNVLGRPMLMGLSRKSFIYKSLGIEANEALNGTSAMHMVALQAGCKILRVHDTKEAMECIQLYNKMNVAAK